MKASITAAQAMQHPTVAETINTLSQLAEKLRSERDALLDRLEKAEKDAERYRWLREQIYVDEDKRLRITRTYLIADQGKTFQERLDDAIDSAMEASK